MPKAILEFSLPDERAEHEFAIHGQDWALCVSDVDAWLRNALKYGCSYDSVDAALEACRVELHESLDGRGLSLEDM